MLMTFLEYSRILKNLITLLFWVFFLDSEQAQEQGVTIIYDMTDAKYSNFGADLSMKLLNLLTVSHHYTFAFFNEKAPTNY